MIDEFKAEVRAVTLTQATHPENRIEPAPEPEKNSALARSIVLAIMAGIVGMIVGVAALSSTLVLHEPASFLSLLPLVVMLVALEAGYLGAMFCMCEEEGEQGSA